MSRESATDRTSTIRFVDCIASSPPPRQTPHFDALSYKRSAPIIDGGIDGALTLCFAQNFGCHEFAGCDKLE